MKRLYKKRNGKFVSLVSLIALSAMLAIFFLALPEFLVSKAGVALAVFWIFTAMLVFTAHSVRLGTLEKQKQVHMSRLMIEKELQNLRRGNKPLRRMHG
ncbi:Hypothetical protein LUCI_4011 [Lucifera butyrica]|uniref:Uncharacterized protein n=1 Tax=Lucifera butyrica TaxID=1351585 RepID=A0A498RF66_9FIRM|nr:hypothetical protein [Lucifera butyrica]VBB08733.1 Hypothetical protein LUCI_4011 [Lucifera butyrica]